MQEDLTTSTQPAKRETLATRLGFIMLSVGCAVGLGNVWRFPYICGKYGGGYFVLLYFIFLAMLGLPVLLMELSVGRAGKSNMVGAFGKLAANGQKIWRGFAKFFFIGNVLLMMYYTTVSGWLFAYAHKYISGSIMSFTTNEEIGQCFGSLTGSWQTSLIFMLFGVVVGTILCCGSLQKTVERSVKYMMMMLFVLLAVLVGKALTMDGALEGLKFYLVPSWDKFSQNMVETIFAALGQAFFTLSLGVGSMEIFGSYLSGQKRSLVKESITIIVLDTVVAIGAGLVIFPACLTFKVDPNAGPGLIFVSLPHVFQQMASGRLWGALFFLFMAMAALTTIVAVFENIIAYVVDEWKFSRKNAALLVGTTIAILSLPCVFGFNLWSSFAPLGKGTCVLDLEDFIVSQNLLPLGGLCTVFFCTWKCGWGQKNFIAEAEHSYNGHFGPFFRLYTKYVLPMIVLIVFAFGYWSTFFSK